MTRTEIREGDRVIVMSGKHRGRHGRVALTHDSDHRVIARLLALHAGAVRVVLDHDMGEGGWSGVLQVTEICRARPETDDELYARMVEAHAVMGSVLVLSRECRGKDLDDAVKGLRLERREVPISEPADNPEGLQK